METLISGNEALKLQAPVLEKLPFQKQNPMFMGFDGLGI